MSDLRQEKGYIADEEFVREVEQAIRDYLFDPDSEKVSTRFKAQSLDLNDSNQKIGAALKQLKSKETVEVISYTGTSRTWRYLGDRDDDGGGEQ